MVFVSWFSRGTEGKCQGGGFEKSLTRRRDYEEEKDKAQERREASTSENTGQKAEVVAKKPNQLRKQRRCPKERERMQGSDSAQ